MKVFSFNRSIVFILLCALVFGVFGCSDSPEGKAAKAMKQSTEKAQLLIETKGDYEKALKEIKKATSFASKAGSAGDPAFIVAGNINFDYADQLQSALVKRSNAVSDRVDNLSASAKKLSYLQIEKNHLESLLDSSDEGINQLEELIDGSSQNAGIKADLENVEADLFRLKDEQEEFIKAERQAHDQVSELQANANEKLNASKTAGGDKKIQIEKEHYDLILAKKEYLVQAQTALDKIKEYQSQIAIVEPLVQKLQNDITDIDRRIDDLEGAPQRSELKRQLRDVNSEIETAGTMIGQLSNSIKQGKGEYEKMLEQIDSLIENALKKFKKIKSKDNKDIAAIRKADCYYASATTNLSAMEHFQNVASRLQAISSSIDGRSSGSVDRLAIEYSGSSNDHSKKTMDAYDQAIKEYQTLGKRAGRGNPEMACSLTKSHILALLGKINLAEQLDEYDLVDEAVDAANELVDKADQCDPDFAESITFKLFNGETDFVPAMSVDKEPEPAEKPAKKTSGKKAGAK